MIDGTWVLGYNSTAKLDVTERVGEQISVLFTGVGFNLFTGTPTVPNNNGTFTVEYTDGSTEAFEWDLVDSSGANRGALVQVAQSGMDLFRADNDTVQGTNDRTLWYQTFILSPARESPRSRSARSVSSMGAARTPSSASMRSARWHWFPSRAA